MKNYEKYEDEIRNYESSDSFCNGFVKPNILKSDHCNGTDCTKCRMLQAIWLLKDYEEPEVDWSKVEVDTPILVRNSEDEEWSKRHFAKCECKGRFIFTWSGSGTSWTEEDLSVWNYAKLPEGEEINNEKF